MFCPWCGSRLYEGASYCGSCGAGLRKGRRPRIPVPMARGLEPVGFWDRLGAAVLDAGLPFLLALLVAGSRGAEALGVYLVLVFLTYWLMLGTLGGTIGMLVLGLVVVDKDGRRIGLWRAGARMAGWALSWLLLGMGHLLIASRRDGRGLHDLLAGTMVVYDREFQALQSDAGD